MASIVLSSVGSSLGNMFLPGLGGRILSSLGRRAGSLIDAELGLASSGDRDGTRLENFKVQDSRYGLPVPVMFGSVRVAGNVIWASDLIETAHEQGGGGKGGALGPSRTTYSYSLHCAVALGEGEIGGVRTVWADSKVIYQNGVWKAGTVSGAVVYKGTDDQAPDPLMESCLGAGNVPAYRKIAYVVFDSLNLSDFGNRLPNLSFEIVPEETTGTPEWLGDFAPDLLVSGYANRCGGALPLILEGGAVSARTALMCGYACEEGGSRCVIVEADISGDAPVELVRAQSPVFASASPANHGWALSPDGRFVAVGFQDGVGDKNFFVMLYDVQTRAFGSIAAFPMAQADFRQIAWLDAQHFVFTETSGGARGVRVALRAGLDVVDLGFHGVWGAGSAGSRLPLNYAQFVPCAGGLMHITGNAEPIFAALYGCFLEWKNSALSAAAPFSLSSGIPLGTGSNSTNFLLRTGEEEWTFVHASVIDASLMSFVPACSGASVTRPWQKIVFQNLGPVAYQAPAAFGDRLLFVQKSAYESAYRLSEIGLFEGSFSVISDGLAIDNSVPATSNFSALTVGANRFVITGLQGSGAVAHVGIARRANTGDTLDRVVAKILERAGYESGDYDVSELAGIPLDGFVIAGQDTALSSLALLRAVEPFDLVESDGRLVAARRGAHEPVAIECADIGAAGEGETRCEGEGAPLLKITRLQELDLPVELIVDALDASRDYEIGSQRARRLSARGAPRVAKLSLPVVADASRTKKIAQRSLYALWGERTRVAFSLSRKWLALDPSDVVELDGRILRITDITLDKGALKIESVSADADSLESVALAEAGQAGRDSALQPVASVLFMMDLPLLRNEDNRPGFYAAVSAAAGWPSATLWRSADGPDFVRLGAFETAATAGSAVTALPARAPQYPDEDGSVRVQLYRGTLSSCTESQLLNGANAALLGGEIIQFRSATLVGPGLYELSHLLRGRRGTEEACGTHGAGEAFVLLDQNAVRFFPLELSERGRTVSFRAVTSGGTLGAAQDIASTLCVRTLEPFAPAHLRAERATGGDILFRWTRRARMNAEWIDHVDVPLDETKELYELEIMNGTAVVRLVGNIETNTLLYTVAQQAEDWPSGTPESLTINVTQIGDLYGRGKMATALV